MGPAEYQASTPRWHRKAFGQFFTPPPVARLMARWVLEDRPQNLLDPAFGLGAFLQGTLAVAPHLQNVDYVAYELDKHILNHLDRLQDQPRVTILNENYLKADSGSFDAILCNPPYMRFQQMLDRHEVIPMLESRLDRKISGFTNISSLFLIKSLAELSPDGRLAYLMPYEFFNTGYGTSIKQSLVRDNLLKHIVLFQNEKDLFQDAITTACVLLCKRDAKADPVQVSWINGVKDLEFLADLNLCPGSLVSRSRLAPEKKWSPILSSLCHEVSIPDGFGPLSDHGTFKRGIATGANSFFCLNRSQIRQHDLGKDHLIRCISKSRQVTSALFTNDDWEQLYQSDKPVHCLDVKAHLLDPATTDYVKRGQDLGFHDRYLTRTKTPWYRLEKRPPPPILVGTFYRDRVKIVRNLSAATFMTCFHGFYPNQEGRTYTDRIFLFLFSDMGQSLLTLNKRRYGDNLDKLEPGDLNASLCPNQSQLDRMDGVLVQQAMDAIQSGDSQAILLCNRLVEEATAGL